MIFLTVGVHPPRGFEFEILLSLLQFPFLRAPLKFGFPRQTQLLRALRVLPLKVLDFH